MLDKHVPRSKETDSKEEILKKLKGLLVANARLAGLLLVGQPAVVTVGISQPLDGLSAPPVLKAPERMSVESPPVRVFSQGEVSWRVRPERPVSGKLELVVGGRTVEKSVEAGPVDWIEVSYPPASVRFLGLEAHWSIWFMAFSLAGAALSRMGR